jgi:hypothetical protein
MYKNPKKKLKQVARNCLKIFFLGNQGTAIHGF